MIFSYKFEMILVISSSCHVIFLTEQIEGFRPEWCISTLYHV